MKLSEVKTHLLNLESVQFNLENGESVPKHFHVTEVGLVTKKFIDCGGKLREERVVSFQLWNSVDFYHRLKANKLVSIIELAEKQLNLPDANVEVEYQNSTIGKYDLEFAENTFILKNKSTACLALDECGVTNAIEKVKEKVTSCCSPDSGCC